RPSGLLTTVGNFIDLALFVICDPFSDWLASLKVPGAFKVPSSRYHSQYPEGSPSTTFPLDHRVFPFAWYLMVYPSMISVFFSAAIICTFTFVFSTVHNQHCILAFRLYWLAICRG